MMYWVGAHGNEHAGCTACPRSTQGMYYRTSASEDRSDPKGQTFMKASVIPAKSATSNREHQLGAVPLSEGSIP